MAPAAYVDGGVLVIPPSDSLAFSGVTLARPIDMSNLAVSVQVVARPSPAVSTYFILGSSNVTIELRGNNVFTQVGSGGSRGPFTPGALPGRWFRIEFVGAQVRFHSTLDPVSGWTEFDRANSVGVLQPLPGLSLFVKRHVADNVGLPAVVDNLNFCP